MINKIIMLDCRCHLGQIYIVDHNYIIVGCISKDLCIGNRLGGIRSIEIKSINDILKARLT